MTSCNCHELPDEFHWDPLRDLLRGITDEVERSASLLLLACPSCGQLWRLDLPPTFRPHARKVVSRRHWTEPPGVPRDQGPSAPLPVLSTVWDAFLLCWEQRRVLLKLAALPWGISVIGTAAVRLGMPPGSLLLLGWDYWSSYAARFGVSFVTAAFFAIAWHRRILLDERVDSWVRCHAWTPRHPRFLVWSFLLGCAWILPSVPIWVLPEPSQAALGQMITSLLLYYPLTRLSVALPSAAVGDPVGLRSAWRFSEGSSVTLVLVVFLAAVPAGLLAALLSYGLFASGIEVEDVALALFLFQETLSFVGAAIGVAALSLAFKRLKEFRATAPTAA